ncbi:hypothetical protein A9P82_13015 [Arachidicoccus ginsenosidimutans]|uniref:lantibiotic dehydratase n=1 Tax=Arachidicoccus sp. BS20 TaxID=1850526 RepID=UPI0007F0A1B4|nr:lantibiotic dehydratase [Arachidicoccus sp. BS20]ANI90123.1 hypothetical protein A9P82_13015 [Arachidicoccus sp. BS20]
MKISKNNLFEEQSSSIYSFHSDVILRTPTLSFKQYPSDNISELLQNSTFRMSIFLASKSLYYNLKKKNFEYQSFSEKEKTSLHKYFNRMSYRTTPFGLFAAFSTLKWGVANNDIQLGKICLHTALDFAEVIELNEKSDSFDNTETVYHSNPTFYKIGTNFRYLCFRNNGLNGKNFFINEIEQIPLVLKIIEFCKNPRDNKEILTCLSKELPNFIDYVGLFNQLIELKIILPATLQGVIEPDFANRISSAEYEYLQNIQSVTDIESLNKITQLDPSLSLCVNAEKEMIKGDISNQFQDAIKDGIFILNALCNQKVSIPQIDDFIVQFNTKFDRQCIPLLQALDPDAGINYNSLASQCENSSLTQNVVFNKQNAGSGLTSIELDSIRHLLLQKWIEQSGNKQVIQLQQSDLEKYANTIHDNNDKLPPSFSVMFRIIDDHQVFIESVSSATATSLIGRFTPFSEKIARLAKDITRIERDSNPHVIFTEINSISDYKTANIERRISVRDYEIPILVSSTKEQSKQIRLSDIWIEIKEGSILLWSKSLGKRIIPRLDSAYNYSRADLAIFRFLCDVQYQDIHPILPFSLSQFFPGFQYYPRVAYKSTILCLAEWHISRETWEYCLKNNSNDSIQLIREMLIKLGISTHFAYTQFDQQLVFNLHIDSDMLLLSDILQKEKYLIIKEFPFVSNQQFAVKDENKLPYISQFITHLYRCDEVYKETNCPVFSDHTITQREFIPCEDWIYYKIYCHSSHSNEIIAEIIYNIVNELYAENLIKKWHYVRYLDPDNHLRLRFNFNGENLQKILKIVNKYLSILKEKRIAQNVIIAEYKRELERYGSENIEDVENVFCTCSNLIMNFLHYNKPSPTEQKYFSLSFYIIDTITTTMGLTIEEKCSFHQEMFEAFQKELNIEDKIYIQLQKKYREFRPTILDADKDVKFFRIEREAILLVTEIKKLSKKIQQKSSVFIDIIHMHLNRLFSHDFRKQEMIMHYLLWRHYYSIKSVKKYA